MAETEVKGSWKDSEPPPGWKDSAPPPDSASVEELHKGEALEAPPKMFSGPWFKRKALDIGGEITDLLPTMGATAGAIAAFPESGGIGSVGGAGIGGMGGTALKQMIYRGMGWPGAPQTSEEAARDITKGGVTQAAIQVPAEVMPMMAGPLNRMASSQYERALAPTTKVNKAITQKIVPEMMQRGVKGSLGSIETRAGEEAAAVGPKLDTAYMKAPASSGTMAGPKILKDLDALEKEYTVNGIPANDQAISAIRGVKDVVKRFGKDIDPDSMRKLKGIFDDPVAKAGGYAGADLSTKYTLQAQEAGANSIRKIMAQASPDVANLNKEITFWLNVQKVAKESGLRRTGQEGGLMKVLGPLGTGTAGALGFIHGGAAESLEAGSIAAVTALATRVVRSPAWRTMSAVTKSRFADALARGSIGEVSALAARFGIAGQEMSNRAPQTSQQSTQPVR